MLIKNRLAFQNAKAPGSDRYVIIPLRTFRAPVLEFVMPNANDDTGKLHLSYIVDGDVIRHIHSIKQFSFFEN